MWHHEISKIVDLQLIRAPMQYVRGSTLKNLNTKIALNISSRRIVSNLALDSPRPLISWKTLTYFSFLIELLNLTISFVFIAHGAFCIVIALAFFFFVNDNYNSFRMCIFAWELPWKLLLWVEPPAGILLSSVICGWCNG